MENGAQKFKSTRFENKLAVRFSWVAGSDHHKVVISFYKLINLINLINITKFITRKKPSHDGQTAIDHQGNTCDERGFR